MKKRIVIFVHRKTRRRDLQDYFVTQLAHCWRKEGIEIRYMTDPRRPLQGDLLFMHIDLSRVPDACLAAAERFPASINGAVGDIRKSAISRQLIGPGSDWNGPVIVKTNLNAAGNAERYYAGTRGRGHPPEFRTSEDYRVYPRLQEVPQVLIENPRLVVEKFLPELVNGEYCTRSYNFLGDEEECFAVYSDLPIVRINTMKRMEQMDVDPRIRELRKAMGFDYGKFDYVIHDGDAILLDANKTPGHLPITDEATRAIVRRRARGIHSFFR